MTFDDDPATGRHPGVLPDFAIDPRGLRLRAASHNGSFVPLLETMDGMRFSARDAVVLDGPPAWLAKTRSLYLLDGSFDARKVVEASQDGVVVEGAHAAPSPRTILRVAPYLTKDEREAIGIADAQQPSAEIALGWSSGALVASLTFIDLTSGVRAPYTALGATAVSGSGFLRFGADAALALRARLLDAGFVPRGSEGFALHGPARAATFIRETLPTWNDLERRLDPGLEDLARGESEIDIAVRAQRSGERTDWFDLRIDVFLGTRREASRGPSRSRKRPTCASAAHCWPPSRSGGVRD